ncbi:MAG TPA: metal ABC transporter ATP-binding protein [Candidatus Limnocylindria bacterium]|jgi:ABC-type Mn2+/Zn2+ transport system ATPase subunit|nr:metal ABC transporter ATP-binding protein [Candidatus Limnocylindria bacterium]
MQIGFAKPSPSAIEVRGLRTRLGNHEVLRGVSLKVQRGQIVALIGPNGSGKTTLLRCLLGIQKSDAGEIRLFDQPFSTVGLNRVGYVPQRLQTERSFILTVREFLALRVKRTHGWLWHSKAHTDRLLADTLEEMGVGALLDRPLAALSGGQLQRVLIAFSLIGSPELLLLDEPTAGVDTPGEDSFYEMMAQVHRRHKLTVVLVSHDLGMVYRHASWVYALNGVICCEGTPEQVMNADSLKQAYGIHVAPYHHHHGGVHAH